MLFYDWVVQKPWGLLVGSMGSLFQVLCKAERAILVCWVVSFWCIYCQKSIAISSSFIRFYIAKCYVPSDIYVFFFHPFRFHYDFTLAFLRFSSPVSGSVPEIPREIWAKVRATQSGAVSRPHMWLGDKSATLEVKEAMVSEGIIPYVYNMI